MNIRSLIKSRRWHAGSEGAPLVTVITRARWPTKALPVLGRSLLNEIVCDGARHMLPWH